MIPVPPLTAANEPPGFDVNCRAPGALWLAANPNKDPHEQSEWWSNFQPLLAAHFHHRCGWLATSIELDGVVDHFRSCGPRKGQPSPHRGLAFEWTNYRYAAGTINSRKATLDDALIDPCEVQTGWFEVLMPSLQMVATEMIPVPRRQAARDTIEKLHLNQHAARFTRWRWYARYWNGGNPNVIRLRQDAPLVAAAIEKANAAGRPLPDPAVCEPNYTPAMRRRPYAPRPRRTAPA